MTRLSTLAAATLFALPLVSSHDPVSALPLTGDHVPLVFGDSLSDPGNLIGEALSVGLLPFPLPQFPNNQITDGDSWATQIGATVSSGRNFAYADARADGDGSRFGLTIPGLDRQIDRFFDRPPPGAVTTTIIFLGGNDLLDIGNPFDPVEVGTVIGNAVGAIAEGVERLAVEAGLTDFLVMGLPNAARLPAAISEASGLGPVLGPALLAGLTGVTELFNSSLRAALSLVPDPAEVTYFDTFAVVEDLIANAASLGVTNTTEPCLTDILNPLTVCGNPFDPDGPRPGPSQYFFYDDLHWSDAVHGALAEEVALVLKPVPLPAGGVLLIAGLGVLAVVRRRRAVTG